MLLRKIGKIVRGRATPFQIFMACLLGTLIAFVPGFWEAPGLLASLLALLVILNANLGLAALAGLLGRLIYLVAVPVSFQVGRLLLDGPTQGLFKEAVNAPVLAYFGFERYLTTGSLAIGFVWGFVLGFLLVKLIRGYRKKIAGLEEGSEAYKKWSSKGWVRALTWVFLGKGKGKKSYDEILAKRIGNPIRILGAVGVAGFVGLAYVFSQFFSGPIVHAVIEKSLERANGATVDIASVDASLSEGKLVIKNLAIADPDDLEKDLFRTSSLEADIHVADALRKRFRIDRLMIREATHGEKRATPGTLTGPQGPAEQPPAPAPSDLPGAKTIDDYLRTADKWRGRLTQLEKWIDRISGAPEAAPAEGPGPGEEPAPGEAPAEEPEETLRKRLEREVALLGYAGVKAKHLIEDAPTFVVTELIVESLRVPDWEGETLSIRGKNLSSHPRLLGEPPSVEVESGGKKIEAEMILGGVVGKGDNTLNATYRGMSVDDFAAQLAAPDPKPIQGGTMDAAIRARWPSTDTTRLQMGLVATLYDSTITLPGAGSAKVSRLDVPIKIRGPLGNPRIHLDSRQLADALVKAGASQLADRVRAEAEGALGDAIDEAQKKAEDELMKEAEGKIGEVLGKEAEEGAKGIGKEVEEGAKGILDGILGGKKKKKK